MNLNLICTCVKSSFSANEKAGFNLLQARVRDLSFIPLTNGTVPPNFMKSEVWAFLTQQVH
jgi:hypothetical protein